MRVKREDNILTVDFRCQPVDLPDNFLVTGMHAIKRSDGEDAVAEFGKIINAFADSHEVSFLFTVCSLQLEKNINLLTEKAKQN